MKKIKNIVEGILTVSVLFFTFHTKAAIEHFPYLATIIAEKGIIEHAVNHRILTDTLWFSVSINGPNESNPSNQEVTEGPTEQTPTGDCAPTHTGQICSVELSISGITDQAAYLDLIDKIDDPMEDNPTIQDFLDIGAVSLRYSRELAPSP